VAQEQADRPVPSVLEPGARRDQAGAVTDDLQRLWAPWRAGYLRGEDPLEGCPFCVLPERGDDEANLILARGEAGPTDGLRRSPRPKPQRRRDWDLSLNPPK